MLIIMGTSLKVHGLKKLVKDFARTIHASAPANGKSASSSPKKTKSWAGKVIFVNRTPPAGEWADIIDYHVAGETDVWVDKVVGDWKKMRPADWEVQQTLVGADGEDSPFKVVKDATVVKAKGELIELTHGMSAELSFSIKAGKKKPEADAENIPPEVSSQTATKTTRPAPVSPSKRRQAASHYSDLESSPSKKRDIAAATFAIQKLAIEDSERGLLFGANSTNVKSKVMEVDLEAPELIKAKPTAGSRQTRAAKAKKVIALETKNTTKKTEFWVELEMVK